MYQELSQPPQLTNDCEKPVAGEDQNNYFDSSLREN